jgi:hypothetical protein
MLIMSANSIHPSGSAVLATLAALGKPTHAEGA